MLRLLRLWRIAGRDLGLLWFAVRHPYRPAWLLPALILLGVYAIEPLNFTLPLLGAVDDFVLLPLALHVLLRFLPLEIRAGFAARARLPSQQP
jgi:uncharacterized membrane protein YkvA (DUF1232 family)